MVRTVRRVLEPLTRDYTSSKPWARAVHAVYWNTPQDIYHNLETMDTYTTLCAGARYTGLQQAA